MSEIKRFILIIIDGFGIGYMNDVKTVRPQDFGANTCRHILEAYPERKLTNFEKLGLMNVLYYETNAMKINNQAVYGRFSLMHYGADTFYGHQELMGSKPVKPVNQPFSEAIDKVSTALRNEGYKVEYKGDKLKFLFVNDCVTVADNIEADLGQIYNVTSTLDLIKYEEVVKIGEIVRRNVNVARVIAFGGEGVSVDDILSSVEVKEDKYIGINAPRSGVYKKGFRVIHLGCEIDAKTQAPTIIGKAGHRVVLLGKVADIVQNDYGISIPCVDTEDVLRLTFEETKKSKEGFIAVNVQETDLAGHAQDVDRYFEKLTIIDKYIGMIIEEMEEEDILLVMADHGNDPLIGHSHHTRENVPLLLYKKGVKGRYIGHRKTLSDAAATACEYFGCETTQNGSSFLMDLI